MIRSAVSMLVNQDLTRPKQAQKKAAVLELRVLIAEGKASGVGIKTMDEIKAKARKELGL